MTNYIGGRFKMIISVYVVLEMICLLSANNQGQMVYGYPVPVRPGGKIGDTIVIELSSNSKYFATGTYDGNVILWDVSSKKPIRVLEGHSSAICDVKFSRTNNLLLTGSADCTARLWDINTGKQLLCIKGGLPINTLDLSPNQKIILTGYWRCTSIPWWGLVVFWDAKTGNKVASIKKLMTAIEKIAFSHDGKTILILSTDGLLSLWDANRRDILRTFNKDKSPIEDFCFSPDDRTVLIGNKDGTARLLDVSNGKEVQQFIGHQKSISSVAFSPDGKLVATTSYRGEGARIWDSQTGKELHFLRGSIEYVKFSSDNQYLFTSDIDTVASLWSVASGREEKRYCIYPWTIDERRKALEAQRKNSSLKDP